MNAVPTWRALAALSVVLLAASPAWTGRAHADEAPPAAPPAASGDASASASPVSATGLLPIFGVAVDFDGLPEKAKPDDVVASVQKLWDGYLKKAGFNVIQFPVDARELGDRGAARLAKLCAWAKTNNVRLAPTLLGGSAGEALPADYPDKVGAFATKTIELVGKSGDPSAYAQIMFYQMERPLNHPGNHGPMEEAKAAEILAAAVAKLHGAEQAALAGSSLQATPVLAGASFDYELIRVGAIANASMTEENYTQAYASLHEYLGAVLSAAPVDVVGLEWYPGSLSSQGVERFPDLVSKIQTDFPGKLFLVSTGFSTASGGEEDQSRYYTQTFNNLSDLRTNQGVESSFAGIVWRTALDKAGGEPSPPSSKTPEEMKSWNWPDRAAELTRMWNEPGSSSKEMRWWLGRVESRFGLIGSSQDPSKPGMPKAAHDLLAHLKTSLVAAAASTGAGEIAQELSSVGSAGGVKGVAGAVKEKLQAALFGMLDAWIAKTAENLVSGGGGGGGDGGGSAPPPPPAPPKLADLQVMGIGEVAEIKAGTLLPLSITVLNAGTAPATNVVLYLRDNASNDLGISTPSSISPGGSSVITLPWTPDHPGNYPNVALDAYCDNEGNAADNHVPLGDVPVSPSGGGGGGTGPSGGGGKGGSKYGGLLGNIAIDPKIALGGVKGSLVTKTDPGFIHIEAVRGISPVPMMMTMSGPGPGGGTGGTTARMGTAGGATGGAVGKVGSGGTMTTMGGTGGGTGGTGGGTQTMSYRMQAAPGGIQPIALAFTVTNPFDHMFTSVKGTLKIQNKVVSTKDLGVLFPRQRRTVSFAQWTPPKAGTFPVQIALAGLGPGGRPLNATATDQVVVAPAGGAGSPPPGGATRSVITARNGATGGATGGAVPMTIGSRTPTMQTRVLMPLIAPQAPAQASGPATRGLYLAPGGKRPVVGLTASLLGLTANSIVLTPFPAQAGNDVGVTVRLFNSERVEVKKVKVEVFVGSERLGETTVDVPLARAVIASGFSTWKAKPGRHEVRAVITAGARSGAASKPIDVRPPHGVGAGGVAMLIGRGSFSLSRLAMTAADVRLNPLAPAAGAPVDVSVRVQNPGTTDARGVRVELFADGARLGERSGDIAAGKDFVFSGFPKWTAASGKHTLLLRANASGQITEATREVTVGATLTLVKPLLTTTTTMTTAPQAAPPTAPTTGLKTTAISGVTLATLALRPDLQIGPADISFNPISPKAGSALTISIVVRNVGNAAANGGSVRAILQVDGAESTRREFPVSLAPQGVTTLTWPVTTPSGKSLTAVATATIANDSRADNNEARASTSVAAVLIRPEMLILQPK